MTNIKLTDLTSGGGCGCKVPQNILSKIVRKSKILKFPQNLLVGNENSDDAAVYKISKSKSIVASTDFFTPIVDNPIHFGKIAATNALSDLYAMGSKPLFALEILAAPLDKIPINEIKKISHGGSKVCSKAGIIVAGGHTIKSKELIYGLVALGEIENTKIVKNSGAKHGDQIILTKPLGIGILSAGLKKNCITKKQYKKLINITTELNKCGSLLASKKLVTCMTDITGFGLIGHLKEMCISSRKSAVIRFKKIPVLEEALILIEKNIFTGASKTNWNNSEIAIKNSTKLSEKQKIIVSDPQTSGGLLISVSKKNLKQTLNILNKFNMFEPAIIGEFKNGNKKIEFI